MLFGMAPTDRLPRTPTRPNQSVATTRIEAALLKVAGLVAQDPAFAPVFERLEAELAAAVKKESRMSEAQGWARMLLAQKAMRATSSATCSSDAPLPYRSRLSR